MGNLLNQNPIMLTNTQTSYKAAMAATLGTLFTLRIEKIVWENPGATGHVALIIDPATGNNIARLIAQGAGIPQILDWSAKPKLYSDFAVVQLDSGILQIYTV